MVGPPGRWSAPSVTEPEETAVDLASWLRDLGLERYEATFRENDVSAELLPRLTADDLKDLGITSVGHRRQLLEAIAALACDPVPPPSPPNSAGNLAETAGERRQLTVMFCDLAGSTALSEKLDPEELRSLLHAYRTLCGDVIARYDGFVARYVGDGILTYFGWPTAHEEDAERAARAALEIVHTVTRASSTEALSVRIGIATGPVVVGETTGTGGQSRLAVGSTPNLAVRLQGLAAADQIVIAASTRRLVGAAFELTYLGEHDLKGIAEPVHAWRVERAMVMESRFDASQGVGAMTPLIGREEELDLLLRRWSQAKDGEGQVVLLSGEPGIGKSRILSALRQRLDAQGVQALRFQCSPYYVNSALWPSIDNFERALAFARDETTDSKLDKLEALIVTQYRRPLADVRFVASILSIQCEQRYGALPMTPQKHKDETLRTLVDLTEAAARQQPSVMLFEDAHWADPTTLEALDLLIDRVRTVPLLVVLTHRPEFQSRWSEQGHVGALSLSKLTRTQSAAMVSALAGGKLLPAGLLEKILTRTDGVPLFVEELTRSILESGELKETGDHYEYGGSARAVTIPATLRDSLMARLDRFMPVKEIAQIGAAIGREFSYELIAAVAPMPQAQLDDSLLQLGAAGLAFRRGTPPDAVYTFKHALVQDVAYDSLLKSRRQELHSKIARVIDGRFANIKVSEPEVLAHHLTVAGLTGAAIRQWQSAGELALKRMALTEAISHLNQGLGLVSNLPASVERDRTELALRRSLGVAWMAAKGWPTPEARESLLPALKLTGSATTGRDVLPVYWGLLANTLSQGRVAESLQWAQQLLAIGQDNADTDILVTAHLMMTVSTFWLGDLLACQTHTDALTGLYDPVRHRYIADMINHDPLTGAGVYRAQVSWMLGYPDRAVAECNAKDDHARARGHVFDMGFAMCAGADVFEYRGEPEAQQARVKECERLGRENSLQVLWQVMAPLRYGASLIRAERAADGVDLLRAGLEVREAGGGYGGSNPYLKGLLAEGLAINGDISGAMHIIEQQIEQIERPGWGERCHYAEIRRLEGWLFERHGDVEAAETSYRQSLDWARTQQARSWELRTATSLAKLLQQQGRAAEARGLLIPLYGWFTEGFGTRDLVHAREVIDTLD
jgi:class 3 adenylate cyclase/tetratricopeptide (TPR) repeat protein